MVSKRHVLHVIGNLRLGGAQSVLYHLWPFLNMSEKYAFDFCTLWTVGHFGERLRAEGVAVHCLHSAHKYDPLLVPRLRRLVQQNSYDIVHVHLFPELLIAGIACRGLQVKLIYTEHVATNRRRTLGLAGRLLDTLAYRPYRRIIAINRSTEANLVNWVPEVMEKTVLIPNAVRVDSPYMSEGPQERSMLQQLGIDYDSNIPILLFAGRLTRQKGVDTLLLALSELSVKNYICLIAGDGLEYSRLQGLSHALGLQGHVRFLGYRSDVPDLLSEADILVLPSRWEGLPLIVLEAMAANCPVVASNVDGIAEVLRHEHSALLVPPDNPAAMAAAIERLLLDASLRQRLAAQARRDVEAYSAENIAKRLIALYDEVLTESS